MSTTATKDNKASKPKDNKASKPKDSKKNKNHLTSRQIDAKYVGRTRYVLDLLTTLIGIYDNPAELAAMNCGKRGRPYTYTHSLIAAISVIRTRMHIDFRGCEAILPEGIGPDFTTIFKRINNMSSSVRNILADIKCENTSLWLIPDGTGITPTTRSEYVRVVHKLRRGFHRLTIIINKETLEIVAFQLTDDSVGEATVFEALLHDALKNMGVDPDERRAMVLAQHNNQNKTYRDITLMADGGYDSGEIFSICKNLDITTNIRIRKNANARTGGVDRARSEAVLDQFGDGKSTTPVKLAAMDESEREENRKKWKTRVQYGTRWLVEIVISAFKRTYGDSVSAKKMENVHREIKLKICTYNQMLQIGREAMAAA